MQIVASNDKIIFGQKGLSYWRFGKDYYRVWTLFRVYVRH